MTITLSYHARSVLDALAALEDQSVPYTFANPDELAQAAALGYGSYALKGLAQASDAGWVRYQNDNGELRIWPIVPLVDPEDPS